MYEASSGDPLLAVLVLEPTLEHTQYDASEVHAEVPESTGPTACMIWFTYIVSADTCRERSGPLGQKTVCHCCETYTFKLINSRANV